MLPTLLHAVVPELENGLPVAELTALPLVFTLAHLVDLPHTRCHLHAGVFLQAKTRALTTRHEAVKHQSSGHVLAVYDLSRATLKGTGFVARSACLTR